MYMVCEILYDKYQLDGMMFFIVLRFYIAN